MELLDLLKTATQGPQLYWLSLACLQTFPLVQQIKKIKKSIYNDSKSETHTFRRS